MQDILQIIVAFFVAVVAIATVLSYLPLAHGLARSLDFPRLQILVLMATLLVAVFMVFSDPVVRSGLISSLVVVIGLQLRTILPYTPLWPKQSVGVSKDAAKAKPRVSLLLSNVLQYNTDHAGLSRLIEAHDPDICIFMETDETWHKALASLALRYDHRVERIQDNTYGMMLWSRLPLRDPRVRGLVQDDIPSITTDVILPGVTAFRLFAVHPQPPTPASATAERDAEIVMVGLEAAKADMPVIVGGDLNDVAWSRTTARFLRTSGLLDPRIGRGMRNSFHAHYWFMRWPLDHLFHSDVFSVLRFDRLPAYGSDHFPMLAEIVYDPKTSTDNPPDDPKQHDIAEAENLIDAAGAPKGYKTVLNENDR